MTLVTFQDGKAVLRDGKVGTEQGCCCGCPPGCPSLETLATCMLRVTEDYGTFTYDREYFSAADFTTSDYGGTCALYFEVADIPYESGGDYGGVVTISRSNNCCPIISDVDFGRSFSCVGDPNVNCVKVIISLECGANCCSPTWIITDNGENPEVVPCNPLP